MRLHITHVDVYSRLKDLLRDGESPRACAVGACGQCNSTRDEPHPGTFRLWVLDKADVRFTLQAITPNRASL